MSASSRLQTPGRPRNAMIVMASQLALIPRTLGICLDVEMRSEMVAYQTKQG